MTKHENRSALHDDDSDAELWVRVCDPEPTGIGFRVEPHEREAQYELTMRDTSNGNSLTMRATKGTWRKFVRSVWRIK